MSANPERPPLALIDKRSHILQHVIEGTTVRSNIQRRCEESRSTVYRALEQLTEYGLLVERSREYEPTALGRRLFSEYERYRARTTDVLSGADILDSLPKSSVPNEVLIDADVVRPNRYSTTTPLAHLVDALDAATTVEWYSPVLRPRYVELWTDLAVDESTRILLLLQSEAMAHLEREVPDARDALANETRTRLESNESDLPFCLVVTDGPTPETLLVVHDERGTLRGTVRNATDSAVEWAHDTFAEHWTEAATKMHAVGQ